MDLESINIKIQPLKVLINRSNTSNISTYFKNKDEGKEYIDSELLFLILYLLLDINYNSPRETE